MNVTAERAWVALAVSIAIYELVCPRGELLSEGVDRWLVSRPWLTRVTVVVTALHLLNVLDRVPWVDPFKLVGVVRRWSHVRASTLILGSGNGAP